MAKITTPRMYAPLTFPTTDGIETHTFTAKEYKEETRAQVHGIVSQYSDNPAYRSAWYWSIGWQTDGDRLHKRISRFLFREYGIKMERAHLDKIAEHAASARSSALRFDVTRSFDWNPGAYSDDRSCYWGGYTNARCLLLPKLGTVALRTYTDDTDEGINVGNGRCWIAPIPTYLTPTGDPADGEFVTFNYYGACDRTERVTAIACAMLARTYGGAWQALPISNLMIDGAYVNGTQTFLITRQRPDKASVNRITITNADIMHSTLPIPVWASVAWEDHARNA